MTSASPLFTADCADNRLEQLPILENRRCSADRIWCVEIVAGSVHVLYRNAQKPIASILVAAASGASVWPYIVRQAGDGVVLVGIIRREGSANEREETVRNDVTLYQVSRATGTARPVFTFVLSSSRNLHSRPESGPSNFTYVTVLRLDEKNASGPARFILDARATVTPVQRASQIVRYPPRWVGDPPAILDEGCTFQREIVWDDVQAQYVFRTPPPNCSDFWVR